MSQDQPYEEDPPMPAAFDHAGRTRKVPPISFRVSKLERRSISAAARSAKLPLSEYVRRRVLAAAESEAPPAGPRAAPLVSQDEGVPTTEQASKNR